MLSTQYTICIIHYLNWWGLHTAMYLSTVTARVM